MSILEFLIKIFEESASHADESCQTTESNVNNSPKLLIVTL